MNIIPSIRNSGSDLERFALRIVHVLIFMHCTYSVTATIFLALMPISVVPNWCDV